MTLNDLTHEEQVALAALSEMSLITDRELAEAEQAQLDEIVRELGEEKFRELLEEAETRFAGEDELRAFLKGITRPEARELIFGTVLNEALLETMPHAQSSFLEWLAGEWNVPVQIDRGEQSPQA